MAYRCEVTSIKGFVQQIVTGYLHHGYWWYVTGTISRAKNLDRVDENIIGKYEIDLPRREKTYRKRLGYANLHYLRFDRFFVILATDGRHKFRETHLEQVRDIREVPLTFEGYSISYRPGGFKPKETWADPKHPEQDHRFRGHVRIRTKEYKKLRAYFLEMALSRSTEFLSKEFWNVPFEPYSPVIGQLHKIRREVNRMRERVGMEPIDKSAVRYRRKVVKPFEQTKRDRDAA